MAANQSAPGLNRGLSSNFWWLSSAEHGKFTEQCRIYTGKHVSIKKGFTNRRNINLPREPKSKNQSIERKSTNFLVKKEFCVWDLVKEIKLTIFWEIKGSNSIGLLEKNVTIKRERERERERERVEIGYIYIYIIYQLHHQELLPDSLSWHSFLSSIATGRSSRPHPVSVQSFCR